MLELVRAHDEVQQHQCQSNLSQDNLKFTFPKFVLNVFSQAVMLNIEVTLWANNFRNQYMKATKAFEATSTELEQKLADLTSML